MKEGSMSAETFSQFIIKFEYNKQNGLELS